MAKAPLRVLLFVLLCTSTISPALGEDPPKPGQASLSGLYCGTILSSGQDQPAFTRFDDTGPSITGTYGFLDPEDKIAHGTLEACTMSDGRVLTCTWRDAYGTGPFEATFAADFSSFSGHWQMDLSGLPGPSIVLPPARWTGHREDPSASDMDCLAAAG